VHYEGKEITIPGRGADLVSLVLYFRVIDPNKAIVGVENYLYATSQLKSKDLGSDEPGRSFDSHGARHSFQQEVGLAAQVAEVFAKQLAVMLEEGRVGKRYGRLVLVAEAHFLGILRAVLSRETSALVMASVNKDLGHVKTHEMSKHLQDVLQL
jgi:protein required for attachment to host cells